MFTTVRLRALERLMLSATRSEIVALMLLAVMLVLLPVALESGFR